MKTISRYFVGGLFIFSGLIKLNDPVGLAIKLEEYFKVFAADGAGFFNAFVPFVLTLSVIFCVAEVVLGIMLILRFLPKVTVSLLLLMIVFFTFLTFYSAYFNKVTDCGCFGDAVKLTPWQSFFKDILLLIPIIYLFINRKKIVPGRKAIGFSVTGAALLLCIFLGIYAVRHLPFIDLRVYKVGNNIEQLRQPEEPCKILYILEKDGVATEYTKWPGDVEYDSLYTRTLNEDKCVPKITDYEGDFVEKSLVGNKLLIVINDLEGLDENNFKEIAELVRQTESKVKPMILTAAGVERIDQLRHEVQLPAEIFEADMTLLKTMIRSNPGLILISNGTVKRKWHWRDTPDKDDLLSEL